MPADKRAERRKVWDFIGVRFRPNRERPFGVLSEFLTRAGGQDVFCGRSQFV
jgi:hypothetical protein